MHIQPREWLEVVAVISIDSAIAASMKERGKSKFKTDSPTRTLQSFESIGYHSTLISFGHHREVTVMNPWSRWITYCDRATVRGSCALDLATAVGSFVLAEIRVPESPL